MNEKIYCGSGKTKTGQYGEFFGVSICLDDIPSEHITTAKNGKRYVNLNINRKQAPDQYGKDLSVQVDTWKPNQATQAPQSNGKETNDLPF